MAKRNWLRFKTLAGGAVLFAATALAGEPALMGGGGPAETESAFRAVGLGAAAAAAVAIGILGAGYAVGRIGSAALGAAAEKPELLTRSILFVALAEGLAVLGFAISMMLVQKI
jgi:V/A-type H+/Na+-transporting ATPase subunit K